MGDLNGHTNTENNFTTFYSNIPLPMNYKADIEMKRKHDTRPTDNRRKYILDMWKASSMKIISGRKLGDTNGRFTCFSRNVLMPSVIDYTIADSDIFQEITYFRVDNLMTFSDHCAIFFRLKANFLLNSKKRFKQYSN